MVKARRARVRRTADAPWAGRWAPRRSACQGGSVSAEFAVLLPAVTALLALLLLAAGAGILQLRLEEGARAGARALARGESTAVAMQSAGRLAGPGAVVSVELSDGYGTVTVRGRLGGPLSSLLAQPQTARASAKLEGSWPEGLGTRGIHLSSAGRAGEFPARVGGWHA